MGAGKGVGGGGGGGEGGRGGGGRGEKAKDRLLETSTDIVNTTRGHWAWRLINCSVQFRSASTRSGKPICGPPCLLEVSIPALPLKQLQQELSV